MRSEKFWQWYDNEAAPRLTGRERTFRLMFEHLDRLDYPPVIVETGCLDDPENFAGNGCSTLLFDMYCQHTPGAKAFSVDINRDAVEIARACVTRRTTVMCQDSVKYLRHFASHARRKIDLLYLDGSDLQWAKPVAAQLHHMNELMAAMPVLTPYTMVAVDDSPIILDTVPRVEIGGKGGLIARYATSVGANLEFTEYQTGWTNITADVPNWTLKSEDWRNSTLVRIDELISQARDYVETGNLIAACSLYSVVLTLTMNCELGGRQRVARGEACACFARVATKAGKYGTAVDWYNEALSADPLATEYRMELALHALRPLNARRSALAEATRATRISPEELRAWHIRGGLEHELGKTEDCIASYDKALEIAPDDPDAMLDRVTIAIDVGDYKLARELAEKALQTERAADGWNALGVIEFRERNYEKSIEDFQKAIDGNCYDAPMAHWNRSVSLHSIGRYREAWIEHEWRDKQKTNPVLSVPLLRFNLPVWNGEPAVTEDRMRSLLIHVHDEAGAGDVIAMSRYLPMMLERGYRVRFEVREDMLDLMRESLPAEIELVKKAPDYPGALGIDKFDYHCPVGRLPMIFETDIDTVPAKVPYMFADKVLAAHYESELMHLHGRRVVGLCWSSGIREGIWMEHYGRNKSVALKRLLPIVHAVDRVISLQVGDGRSEIGDHPVLDVLPQVPSWADTAALIENLDLVITVDTSVAHLAGAMGKPTWLMMHTQGSWHWMAEQPGSPWNTRSPWYPSVRIFRAKEIGEWEPVVHEIVLALHEGRLEAAE